MNCTELDDSLGDAREFFAESDTGFGIAIVVLILTSMALLAAGEHFVRPLSATIAGVTVAGFVFVLSEIAENAIALPCEVRLIVSGVAGILAAILALCLLKTGLFLIGAGGFGVVAHYAYDALPLDEVPAPFLLVGRSAYYYLVILLAGIVGAVASHWQRTHFVRLSSALLGGGGIAWSVHLISFRATGKHGAASPLVLLGILAVFTGIGVALQRHLAHRRQRRRSETKRDAPRQSSRRPSKEDEEERERRRRYELTFV